MWINSLLSWSRKRILKTGEFPPGHFYSSIPNLSDVRRHAERIFDRTRHELPGIDLNVEAQLELLEHLAKYYPDQPFDDNPRDGLRYSFRNDYFGYSSGIFLFCLLRHWRPARVIEIGSGFSSFVMLDTNERFLANAMHLTFIEPNPERLRSGLKDGDLDSIQLEARPLQDLPLSCFEQLSGGDILFVDSSHVSKIGSDVNYILFEILPRLKPGVFVHFHDIFYPFEYPEAWIEAGRFWNEAYMLRTFLTFNREFKVAIWNQFLGLFYPEKLAETMPLCLKSLGSSLWLERLQRTA